QEEDAVKDMGKTLERSNNQSRIVPNPLKADARQFSVAYETEAKGSVEVMLVDGTGKMILRRSFDVEAGLSHLTINLDELRLAPALYYLSIRNGEGVQSQLLRVIE